MQLKHGHIYKRITWAAMPLYNIEIKPKYVHFTVFRLIIIAESILMLNCQYVLKTWPHYNSIIMTAHVLLTDWQTIILRLHLNIFILLFLG